MKRLLIGLGAAVALLPGLALSAIVAPTSLAPTTDGSDALGMRAAPAEMRGYFTAAARRFALPPALLLAIAQVESGFTPTAVGPPTPYGRALGMMQFLPSSWQLFNVVPGATPFDPAPAVLAAANHLLHSGRLANGGWDAAQAVYGYNHSQAYVATVLSWAARFGYRYDPRRPPLDAHRYRFPVRSRSVRVGGAGAFAHVHASAGTRAVACVRSEVVAVTGGAVTGAAVTLRGEDGWLYHYRHLAHVSRGVRTGAVVDTGAVLGRLEGRHGADAAGSMLTFGISRGDATDRWIDARPYLRLW